MIYKTIVIENPSKALVDLVNKLRARKMEKLEEMNKKKDSYLKIKIGLFDLRNNVTFVR